MLPAKEAWLARTHRRAFLVVALQIWNTLSLEAHLAPVVLEFWRRIKTELFQGLLKKKTITLCHLQGVLTGGIFMFNVGDFIHFLLVLNLLCLFYCKLPWGSHVAAISCGTKCNK